MAKKLDLLDSADIDDCRVDLSFKNGFVFSQFLLFFVFIMGLLGIIAMMNGELGYFFGPPLILLAIFGLTYRHGTDISVDNQYIRPYSRLFGVKTDKWIPTTLLVDMAILKMGKTIGIQYEKTSEDQRNKKGVYDLYLLSTNHRKRVYITSFSSMKKAYEEGQYIADLLAKRFTTFQPVISKATRAKRYERHY